MQDGIIWLVVLALLALGFWSLARDNERRRNRTAQEFERDLADTKNSLLRAGMLELDKFVGNESQKRAAVEYLKDEEQGMTKTGGQGDNVDRTADK